MKLVKDSRLQLGLANRAHRLGVVISISHSHAAQQWLNATVLDGPMSQNAHTKSECAEDVSELRACSRGDASSMESLFAVHTHQTMYGRQASLRMKSMRAIISSSFPTSNIASLSAHSRTCGQRRQRLLCLQQQRVMRLQAKQCKQHRAWRTCCQSLAPA